MKGVRRFLSLLSKNNKTASVKVNKSQDMVRPQDVAGLSSVATLVSPPDPVSNLRHVKLRVPEDESAAEAQFRALYTAVQDWNQEYWTKHNTDFQRFTDIKDYLGHSTSFLTREQLKAHKSLEAQNYLTSDWVQQPLVRVLPDGNIVVVGKANNYDKKDEFIRRKLDEYSGQGIKKENVAVEEMAEFYRTFLNDNHQKHVQYNWTWYKKNFGLLWPAIKSNWAYYSRELQNSGFQRIR